MRHYTIACIALGGALACAGKSSHRAPSGSPGASASAREPDQHRPSGSLCPSQRSAVSTTPKAGCSEADAFTECLLDSECPGSNNGRCVFGPHFACVSACQYDDCYSDAECPGQACVCRADASSPGANYCDSAGNCRVDADCGEGGYCSPSLLGGGCTCLSAAYCDPPEPGAACGDSCGHGYFCHSARDGCLDDSDCKSDEHCAFDKVEQRFSCQGCLIPP